VILLADSTKFDRHSIAQVCELSSIDRMVVDDKLSEAWQQQIADAGVELILAKELAEEAAEMGATTHDMNH
jgi:DeoR/GlpR family transcriptional regulator of sugar metabolism